jgi:hypothetical protein
VQYAITSLIADEPIKMLRKDRLTMQFFQRLQHEYSVVVEPGRRAAGLPAWSPPPGFFPATRPPRTAETRKKISDSQRGRIFSAEHRSKISAALRGHATTEQTRAAVAAANHRRVWTDESRAKIGVAGRSRQHAEATRAKIATAARNRLRAATGRWL